LNQYGERFAVIFFPAFSCICQRHPCNAPLNRQPLSEWILFELSLEYSTFYNEENPAGISSKPMGALLIGHDKPISPGELQAACIFQLKHEFAFQAVNKMAITAPMIGQISTRVLN
jgi:hypothetical protein